MALVAAFALSGCLNDNNGSSMVLMSYYDALAVPNDADPSFRPTMSFGADRQLKVLQDAGIQASIHKCATLRLGSAGVDSNGDPLIPVGGGMILNVVLYLVTTEQVAAAKSLNMRISEQGPDKELDPARTTYYDCHSPG
ncbi:MAG: hypothetical protein KBD60_04015 [Sterolibacterium sp.]|jgi:hypothetical protein|nr:hypothetical protein [Sterolibacterium sp.]